MSIELLHNQFLDALVAQGHLDQQTATRLRTYSGSSTGQFVTLVSASQQVPQAMIDRLVSEAARRSANPAPATPPAAITPVKSPPPPAPAPASPTLTNPAVGVRESTPLPDLNSGENALTHSSRVSQSPPTAIDSPVSSPNPLKRESRALRNSLASSQSASRSGLLHSISLGDIPEQIGPYAIKRILGRGGMSIVYLATHMEHGHDVALKLLRRQGDNDRAVERFMSEAELAAKLDSHTHIVKVLDFGRAGHDVYMALELIQGTDLRQLIDAGKVKPRPGARVVADIAGALAYAHEFGIIHRDIKPANIMIDRQSRARLTDFGIAKLVEDDQDVTMTGAIVGTLPYMAPEQAVDSKNVDVRSDVYGLGAVLYECLTGRTPHVGSNSTNVLASLLNSEPPKPRELNPEVDPYLEKICLKALAKDPDQRYQTATELMHALDRYRFGEYDEAGWLELTPSLSLQRPRAALFTGLVLGLLLTSMALNVGLYFSATSAPASTSKSDSIAAKPEKTKPEEPLKFDWRLDSAFEKEIVVNGERNSWDVEIPFVSATQPLLPEQALLRLKSQNSTWAFISPVFGQKATLTGLPIFADKMLFEIELSPSGQLSDFKPVGSLSWSRDTDAPTATWTRPEQLKTNSQKIIELSSNEFQLNFSTSASDIEQISYDPLPSTSDSNNSKHVAKWSVVPDKLTELKLRLKDKAGNESEYKFKVRYSAAKLSINIKQGERVTFKTQNLTLNGTVKPATATVKLIFQGRSIDVIGSRSGHWKATVDLGKDFKKASKLEVQARHGIQKAAVPVQLTFDSAGPARVEARINGKPVIKGVNNASTELMIFSVRFNEFVNKYKIEYFSLDDAGKKKAIKPRSIEWSPDNTVCSMVLPARTPGRYSAVLTCADKLDNSSTHKFEFRQVGKEAQLTSVSIKFDKLIQVAVQFDRKIEKLTINSRIAQPVNEDSVSFKIGLSAQSASQGLKIIATAPEDKKIQSTVAFIPELLHDATQWKLSGEESNRDPIKPAERQLCLAVLAENLEKTCIYEGLKSFESGKLKYQLPVFRSRETGLVFHLIPGQELTLPLRMPDKKIKPAKFKVRAFLLCRDEISRADYTKFVPRSFHKLPYKSDSNGKTPAMGLTFKAVEDWLDKASDRRFKLRMPSLIEWHYACRGGSPATYHTGSDVKPIVAAFAKAATPQDCHKADPLANAFGLNYMLGNAREWCADKVFDWNLKAQNSAEPFTKRSAKNGVVCGVSYQRAKLNSKEYHVLKPGFWLPVPLKVDIFKRQKDQLQVLPAAEKTLGTLGFRPAADLPRKFR